MSMSAEQTSAQTVTITHVPGDTKTASFIEGGTVADYLPNLDPYMAVSIDGQPAKKEDIVEPGATLMVASKASNG